MRKFFNVLFVISALSITAMAQTADSTAPVKNDADNESAIVKEKVTELNGKLNGLEESFLEAKATVDALKKIKVSGYIQAQYQVADVGNVLSLNSAKSASVRQAFLIKRGRIKTTYDAGISKYVLELDVTQDGVGIKDAYASFSEPWLKAFSLTIGAQDRPFGYEIGYSSSMLESPERSKMIGNLFPKEKDLGAMLEFNQEEGPLSFLNVKFGVFNGGTNGMNEYDDFKDMMGRLGFKWGSQELGLAIEGGASGYYGTVANRDSTSTGGKGKSYEMSGTAWSVSAGHQDSLYKRKYYGADLQLFYATPVIGGTCVKGEYIQGYHPTGTGNTNMSGAADFYGNLSSRAAYLASGPLYNRQVNGFYAYLVQNIDPTNSQLVVKYDMWDPNTQVKASDFVAKAAIPASGTTPAVPAVTTTLTKNDLAISTIGFGLLQYLPWSPNVRLMVYYEIPTYEKLDAANVNTGSLVPMTKTTSATNMNMLTLRVQYKF